MLSSSFHYIKYLVVLLISTTTTFIKMSSKNNNNANQVHALRISDMVAEPGRMFAPIQGFENMPLVSLEDAVKPLISLIPKVSDMVYIVTGNCQQPADNLSTDESASIMLYTLEWTPKEDSFYYIFNNILRGENRQKIAPWFLYLRLFMTSLLKLPTNNAFVYRGVKMDLSMQYPQGKTFVWWGFSSCTSSIKTLEIEQFFGKSGTRTLFSIECHSGKNIQKHSMIPSEEEILLPAARQFKVVSSLDAGKGLHIIQIKEIEPPFPFLGQISQFNTTAASYIKPHQAVAASTIIKKQNFTHQNLKLEQILTKYKSQSAVRLSGNQLTDQDMEIVVEQAINNKQCTELNLMGNEIASDGASILADGLRNNTKLVTLNLSSNLIGDVGVHALVDSMNSSAVKILDLGENSISDEGARYLAEMLKTNQTLVCLLLNQNEISDEGVQVLANALANKESILETLNLSSNKDITDESIDYLLHMIKRNVSLKKLDMRHCPLSNDSQAKLVEAFKSREGNDVWVSDFF